MFTFRRRWREIFGKGKSILKESLSLYSIKKEENLFVLYRFGNEVYRSWLLKEVEAEKNRLEKE